MKAKLVIVLLIGLLIGSLLGGIIAPAIVANGDYDYRIYKSLRRIQNDVELLKKIQNDVESIHYYISAIYGNMP